MECVHTDVLSFRIGTPPNRVLYSLVNVHPISLSGKSSTLPKGSSLGVKMYRLHSCASFPIYWCVTGSWTCRALTDRVLQAMNTARQQLWRTGSFTGGGGGSGSGDGIYAPGEMAKVSGARFVWPCPSGQGMGVGRYLIYILRGSRGWVYLIKSNRE